MVHNNGGFVPVSRRHMGDAARRRVRIPWAERQALVERGAAHNGRARLRTLLQACIRREPPMRGRRASRIDGWRQRQATREILAFCLASTRLRRAPGAHHHFPHHCIASAYVLRPAALAADQSRATSRAALRCAHICTVTRGAAPANAVTGDVGAGGVGGIASSAQTRTALGADSTHRRWARCWRPPYGRRVSIMRGAARLHRVDDAVKTRMGSVTIGAHRQKQILRIRAHAHWRALLPLLTARPHVRA